MYALLFKGNPVPFSKKNPLFFFLSFFFPFFSSFFLLFFALVLFSICACHPYEGAMQSSLYRGGGNNGLRHRLGASKCLKQWLCHCLAPQLSGTVSRLHFSQSGVACSAHGRTELHCGCTRWSRARWLAQRSSQLDLRVAAEGCRTPSPERPKVPCTALQAGDVGRLRKTSMCFRAFQVVFKILKYS